MKKFCLNAKSIDRMCPNGAKTSKGKNGQEWAKMGKNGHKWAKMGKVGRAAVKFAQPAEPT